MRAPGLALAWAILLATAAPALAHRSFVKRAILIEPAAGARLEVVFTITVPGGKARGALVLLADRDRDGKLTPGEETNLRAQLTTRALDGVRLQVGSATVALADVSTKLRVDPDPSGPLVLMLHGVAPLPPSVERVQISTADSGDPAELRVLAGARPVATTSRGKLVSGGFATTLAPSDAVWWTIKGASAPDGTPPR